jgi:GxxExxY protein
MQYQNDIERLIQLTFDVGMAIHRDVGPGLMESVYENVLADRLQQNDIKIDRNSRLM